MEIKDVKEINKGALKLKFSLYFPETGFTFREVLLMEGKTGQWVSFPSKEYQDRDGQKKYFPYICVDDNMREMFQKTCLEMLKNYIKKPLETAQNNEAETPW